MTDDQAKKIIELLEDIRSNTERSNELLERSIDYLYDLRNK